MLWIEKLRVEKKIKVLVIGDSYYHGLQDTGLEKWVFGDSEYWYYFDAIEKNGKAGGHVLDKYNVKKKMNSFDLVLIVMTQGTLQFTPDRFFKDVYNEYAMSGKEEKLKSLTEFYTKQIYSDKNWLADVKKKAIANNETLQEAVKIDAIYMAKQKLQQTINQ